MADRYFVGDTDSDWNDANNWAAASGGAGGAEVPGSGDTAIFDGYSPDCVCDVEPVCDFIDLQSGFSNKLDFSTYGANVDRIEVAAGELDMGSAKVDINSTAGGEGFRQSGGTVTLTSGTLECNSDFERTAGTLNHNNGTLYMNRVIAADRDLNVNGASLYNVTIEYDAYAVDWDSDVTIEGKLLFISGRGLEGSATITLKGDFETRSTGTVYGTQCTLYIDGTGAQEFKSNSGTKVVPASITIDKASGTLTFVNSFRFYLNNFTFEYKQGTIDWSACPTMEWDCHPNVIKCTANLTIPSSTAIRIGTSAFTTTVRDGELTIEGDFYADSCSNWVTVNNGLVNLKGSTIVFNSSIGSHPGSLLFIVNGAGDQAYSGSGSVTRLKIDKPSGTLTFSGTCRFECNAGGGYCLEYVQGTVVTTGTTFQIGAGANDDQVIKTGALEMNNVTFNPQGFYDVKVDGPCIVKGKLLISSVDNITEQNSGYIDVYGDLESNDSDVNGTCDINLRGSDDQSLLCNNGEFSNGDLTINKTGGSVILGEDFAPASWTGDLTVTQGTLDLAGYDLNIAARTLTITDKLKLKGSETITATLTIGAASTVEYYDDAVEATIDDLATTFYNLILGAGKTHKVTAGVGNGITVNGNFGNTGTSVNRAILRSTVNGTQWELDLQGTSGMSDGVDVQDSDASAGNRVTALNSEDSGNNDNWFFGIGQGGFGLFRPHSFRYNRGICPDQLG